MENKTQTVRGSIARPLLTTALALMAVSAPSASAAVVMSVISLDGSSLFQDPANLELDVLQGGSTATPGANERDVDSNRSNAQSFTAASNFTLDKIAINYQVLVTGGTDTTFEFFRVADAQASALTVQGSILESFTFNGSHSAFSGATTSGTLLFDITDIAVATDDEFAIRFLTGAGTSHSIKWRFIGSYAGGRHYENNGGQTNDYTIGLVAVPEPSSAALLGLAGLGLILRRRR